MVIDVFLGQGTCEGGQCLEINEEKGMLRLAWALVLKAYIIVLESLLFLFICFFCFLYFVFPTLK